MVQVWGVHWSREQRPIAVHTETLLAQPRCLPPTAPQDGWPPALWLRPLARFFFFPAPACRGSLGHLAHRFPDGGGHVRASAVASRRRQRRCQILPGCSDHGLGCRECPTFHKLGAMSTAGELPRTKSKEPRARFVY